MTRVHFYRPVQNATGDLVPGVSVRLLQPGTTTLITATVYDTLVTLTPKTNPWTSPGGVIDFYLDVAQTVRVGVTPPGEPETFFEDVSVGGAGGGAASGGTIVTVNSDPGPNVTLSLDSLIDVYAPAVTFDGQGTIITQPEQNASPKWNQDTGRYEVGPPIAIAHEHTGSYAPAGYEAPYTLHGVLLASGDTEPSDLPADALVFDEAALMGGGVIPADFGFKTWTLDPAALGTGASNIDAGRQRTGWLPVRGSMSLDHLAIIINGAAVGSTSIGFAFYDASDGTRLGYTNTVVDELGAATTFESTGIKIGVFSTPIVRDFKQHVIGTVWFNGTTAPTMARGSSNVSATTLVIGGGFVRSGQTSASTATTATPPTPIGTVGKDSAVWMGAY